MKLWLILLWMAGGLASSQVVAHELEIHWEVRGDQLVIHAESEGEPAAGATVQLFSNERELLGEGQTGERGTWTWQVSQPGEFTVEVDAGFGHHEQVSFSISSSDGWRPVASRETPDSHHWAAAGSSGEGPPLVWRVGLGCALLLSLSAAWMSWGNMRRIRALESKGGGK